MKRLTSASSRSWRSPARDRRRGGEALFTLGDKPELRHPAARQALAALGYRTTIETPGRGLRETGLLPHVNAGVMGRDELIALREVSASQGLMLETEAERLGDKGGPHYRSPG